MESIQGLQNLAADIVEHAVGHAGAVLGRAVSQQGDEQGCHGGDTNDGVNVVAGEDVLELEADRFGAHEARVRDGCHVEEGCGHQSRLSRTVARTWSHHSPASGMRSSGDQHHRALVARKPASVNTSWGWWS